MVAGSNNSVLVKRISIMLGKIALISDNLDKQNNSTILVEIGDSDSFKILGLVPWKCGEV